MFSEDIIQSAINHALSEAPKESCGVVLGGVYVPLKNTHENPEMFFKFDRSKYASLITTRRVKAIIHSHTWATGANPWPSGDDARSQQSVGLPYGIVVVPNPGLATEIVWFGPGAPIAPVKGRDFRHYTQDCYALMRDCFRLGKDALAEQGIVWPYDPVDMIDFPRDEMWWENRDQDLLTEENFKKAGFYEIRKNDLRSGDVILFDMGVAKFNHVGVYVGDGKMLHHMSGHSSRTSPANPYFSTHTCLFLRYDYEKKNTPAR